MPLVIVLHGSQVSALGMLRVGFNDLAERNGCTVEPAAEVSESTSERVLREAAICEQGREVTLYTIEGGVQAWPGAPRGENDLPLGANEEAPASMAISATPIIWEFFQAHPAP
jgi:poly(3-hydroxybutyrate) depolymerase